MVVVEERQLDLKQAREYEANFQNGEQQLKKDFNALKQSVVENGITDNPEALAVISRIDHLMMRPVTRDESGDEVTDAWITDKQGKIREAVMSVMKYSAERQGSEWDRLLETLSVMLASSEAPFHEYRERELVTAFQTQLHDAFVQALKHINEGSVVLPKGEFLSLVHEKLNKMPEGVITSRQADTLITQLFGGISSNNVTVFVDSRTTNDRRHHISLFGFNDQSGIDPVYEIDAEYANDDKTRVNISANSHFQRIHSDVERMAFMVALAQAVGEAAGTISVDEQT